MSGTAEVLVRHTRGGVLLRDRGGIALTHGVLTWKGSAMRGGVAVMCLPVRLID